MNFIFISEVIRSKPRLNVILNLVLLKDSRGGNMYLLSGTTDYYLLTCFQLFQNKSYKINVNASIDQLCIKYKYVHTSFN